MSLTRTILLAALLSCWAHPAAAVTLKIATLSPEGSSWMKAMRAAGEQVARDTSGRVVLKFYPGGVMGDDKAVLRKIRFRQLHGAALTGGSLTSAFTDVQLYNLPMVFENLGEVDYVRARMDEYILAGLKAHGYTALGIAEVGFAYAMSNVDDASVEGARRQKVWVPDGDPGTAYTAQAFGIAPVPLTIADVLAGLQTGLINAVAMPPVGAVALQWHTQLKYLVDLPLMYVYGTFVLANDSIEGLSEADRAVVNDVLSTGLAGVDAGNRKDHTAALGALGRQGVKSIEPTSAQVDVWRDHAHRATEHLLDQEVVTRAAYETMMAHLTAYRGSRGQ